jgi:hypothetical protein
LGCGWGEGARSHEFEGRSRWIGGVQRWFLIGGCSEWMPIIVLIHPGGGPVLFGGISRRRWVGLSGSMWYPIWWMAT